MKKAFIQFSCAAKQTARSVVHSSCDGLFMKHLLRNIAKENVNIIDVFRTIVCDVYRESNLEQRPVFINGLPERQRICLNEVSRSMYRMIRNFFVLPIRLSRNFV